MFQILVIDAQGGGIGKQVIAGLKAKNVNAEICAVGLNVLATQAMLKAGAKHAATGENAVIVGCRTANLVIGPVGIVIADSLYGEVTPKTAKAVGQCQAKRVLIPLNTCGNIVAGLPKKGILSDYIADAIDLAVEIANGACVGE